MNCLNCGKEMTNNLVQFKKSQISYDMCEACGSLWLDAGELDKMAFKVVGGIEYCSQDEAEGISEKTKKCPRCEDTTLNKVFFVGYTDIILDHCRNCGGFWLDGGELDLINRQLEKIMPIEGKGFSEFVNDVHLPHWYKRVKRKNSENDFRVEVSPIKNAKLEANTEYVCPACGENINLYTIYGINIEGCPNCKGIWLDKDELRKLKDKTDKGSWRTLRWMDDEVESIEKVSAVPSKRECPKCKDMKLVSTNFGDSNIIIDWCPSCHGTWLDRDEFQKIVKYLRDKLDALSSAEMKREVYEEIKEIWDGPEGELSEILDAKAAVSALINITIFEHPKLCKVLFKFSKLARSMGL
jgi:Zn-finger nucleic acid-binding protein